MRALWRSGPLLLALGIVWTGCDQASDGPPRPKPAAQSKSLNQDANADKTTAEKKAAVMIPAGTECVLSVEGMA